MKIYTKVGDRGETSLFGGAKVPKDDLRIRTYGTLDELNAYLGLVLTELAAEHPEELRDRLIRTQEELFQLGAELATPRGKSVGIPLVEEGQVHQLETEIDEMEEKLTPMKNFILPGGAKAAALTHVARTVCRRAERDLTSLNRAEPVRPVVLEYVNRLSDYLFVAARWMNSLSQKEEQPWKPRHSKKKGVS